MNRIWPDIRLRSCKPPVSTDRLKRLYFMAVRYCLEAGFSITQLQSKSRKAELVKLRSDIARKAYPAYTQEEIAEVLNRERSNVSHLINQYTP